MKNRNSGLKKYFDTNVTLKKTLNYNKHCHYITERAVFVCG